MAYRFLLEVPESLVEDANVVVNHVPDAEVLLSHPAHGLGIDEGAHDLSIAAHSLRVIQAIYKWKSDIDRTSPFSRNRIRIALHSGERMTVGEVTYGQMVAAIRRDQPWVDHTIPKIGEHQTRSGPTAPADAPLSTPLPRESQVAVVEHDPADFPSPASDSDARNPNLTPHVADVRITATDDIATHATIVVDGIPFINLPVQDLAKPERNYSEVFGLEMIGRANHPEDGPWEFIDPGYDVEQEAQYGLSPDYAFMQNGPLAIALQRVGRGYPLDHYIRIPEPIHLVMDMESLQRVKATVLMRSWDVRDLRPDGFIFRDPFGYTWALVGHNGEGTIH